jgi:hypothetical protein
MSFRRPRRFRTALLVAVVLPAASALQIAACAGEDETTTAGAMTTATSATGSGGMGGDGGMGGSGGMGGMGGMAGSGGMGGMGGSGGMSAMPKPDFKLIDTNPNSPTVNQEVSPSQFLGKVSAWYFGHGT